MIELILLCVVICVNYTRGYFSSIVLGVVFAGASYKQRQVVRGEIWHFHLSIYVGLVRQALRTYITPVVLYAWVSQSLAGFLEILLGVSS